ncbi:MAG: PQQ-dependent dehydrogenase, methanol/ethanol family [Gammaproteobacteria bacterium]|nr:PQQ-dependent dehydrogenase, methanol/ethanol family [Gammaproteobacteria bacterium]
MCYFRYAASLCLLTAALAAAADTAWPSVANGFFEHRYSVLDQINTGNVDRLGLVWYFATGSRRGLEATPVMVDGTLYTTGTWSRVYALDARTGRLKWSYDPQVPRRAGAWACCDVVNRGVAVDAGKVFVGTLDGRLIALDAATGKPVWSVQTTPTDRPYTITMAPRVIDGMVLIGNGGAEYAGVRGYLTAYDENDGCQRWRFYTVPGPADDASNPQALARAAKTWPDARWTQLGGGGTVWNTIAYDPRLKLIYFGSGNASPWNRYLRNGGAEDSDDLFSASILAVHADTGRYAWHFQTTPGDAWDYDADGNLVLVDLPIDGRPRPVILQANKNGFFYVLDRRDGTFISANAFVAQNWAAGIDPKTGRPQLAGRPYDDGGRITRPAPYGGHNWQDMSYSPDTGLVYVPAADVPFLYQPEPRFAPLIGAWGTGLDLAAQAAPPGMDPLLLKALVDNAVAGKLVAWDPVRQRAAWTVKQAMPWNGGTLATHGGLVFEGTADGAFRAYDAGTGKLLWDYKLANGIIASPMTYEIEGTQYVAVMMGWGGSFALSGGQAAYVPGRDYRGYLLVFKLGGQATLPPPQPLDSGIPQPPPSTATPLQIAAGNRLYNQYCAVCHGANAISGSAIPDLRYLPNAVRGALDRIVLEGALQNAGMPEFSRQLDARQVAEIDAYLIKRAQETRASLTQPGWWASVKAFFYRLIAPALNWINALRH